MGRPFEFSQKKADVIIELLTEGRSLMWILANTNGMPSRSTVCHWEDEFPEFEKAMWRARKKQASLMDDLILDTADNSSPEMAQVDRLRIDAYKWRAARLAPRKYGDKLALTGGDDDDNPIKNELTITFKKS